MSSTACPGNLNIHYLWGNQNKPCDLAEKKDTLTIMSLDYTLITYYKLKN